MMAKHRLDQLLVARGLFDSRARAQAAIEAGLVRANGEVARKASAMTSDAADLTAEAPHPWVSRGGVKLTRALDHFRIDPAGRVCLDVGSSTGGFTHVLLQRGASRVVAVDTGSGQMHARLRGDPRVLLFESQDIRTFAPARISEPASLIVVDVSFISMSLIIPSLSRFAAADVDLVALFKPQFEVGQKNIGKNGIVTDGAATIDAIARVERTFIDHGWRAIERINSPIAGGDGNREYLLHVRRAS